MEGEIAPSLQKVAKKKRLANAVAKYAKVVFSYTGSDNRWAKTPNKLAPTKAGFKLSQRLMPAGHGVPLCPGWLAAPDPPFGPLEVQSWGRERGRPLPPKLTCVRQMHLLRLDGPGPLAAQLGQPQAEEEAQQPRPWPHAPRRPPKPRSAKAEQPSEAALQVTRRGVAIRPPPPVPGKGRVPGFPPRRQAGLARGLSLQEPTTPRASFAALLGPRRQPRIRGANEPPRPPRRPPSHAAQPVRTGSAGKTGPGAAPPPRRRFPGGAPAVSCEARAGREGGQAGARRAAAGRGAGGGVAEATGDSGS